MNTDQLRKYHVIRKQWESARKARGLPHDKTALSALKVRKIGRDCSSSSMTNSEFDLMLQGFLAVSAPDDLDAQLEVLESPERRRAFLLDRCDRACWDMYNYGGTAWNQMAQSHRCAAYIDGTAKNMCGKPAAALDEKELCKVMGALEKQASRVRAAHEAAHRVPEATEGNPY